MLLREWQKCMCWGYISQLRTETCQYGGTCLNLMMVAVMEDLPGQWSEGEQEQIAQPGGGSKWAGKKSTVIEETKHAKALWQEVAKQVWGAKRRLFGWAQNTRRRLVKVKASPGSWVKPALLARFDYILNAVGGFKQRRKYRWCWYVCVFCWCKKHPNL